MERYYDYMDYLNGKFTAHRVNKIMTEHGNIVDVVRRYELLPNDNRKSFYGKAQVLVTDDGAEYLQSYDTLVMRRNGETLERLWDGWSATTGRHIVAFCGLNKKETEKLNEVSIIKWS